MYWWIGNHDPRTFIAICQFLEKYRAESGILFGPRGRAAVIGGSSPLVSAIRRSLDHVEAT